MKIIIFFPFFFIQPLFGSKPLNVAHFFTPQPPSGLTFDELQVDNLYGSFDFKNVKGSLTVTPPPGLCVRIYKSENIADEIICEKKMTTFSVEDLDAQGRVNWIVFIDKLKIEQKLTWQTNYRIGQIRFLTQKDSGSSPFILKECRREPSPQSKNRYRLTLLNGLEWLVIIPDRHKPAAPETLASPNLFIHKAGTHFSFKKLASGDGENTLSKGELSDEDSGRKRAIQKYSDWSLPSPSSFLLPTNQIILSDSPPSGGNSSCWYNFGDTLKIHETQIECHNTIYEWVYFPAPCIQKN
jgi:hypothetical protein